MIVRDEAEMLPLTLPPLVEVLDQVVVVDMRSADQTRSICRSLLRAEDVLLDYDPVNLYSFGFEHPRNYGAQHSLCDWILAIDADEYVDAAELAELLAWLRIHRPTEVSSVARRNYARSRGHSLADVAAIIAEVPCDREEQGRFYRNHWSVRWAGLIHEEVWGPARAAGERRRVIPLTLHHLAQFKATAMSAIHHREKTLLYAYLLAKGSQYHRLQFGTNEFWFSTYMRYKGVEMLGYANELALRMGFQTFDDPSILDRLPLPEAENAEEAGSELVGCEGGLAAEAGLARAHQLSVAKRADTI